jgi:hypothetical protein
VFLVLFFQERLALAYAPNYELAEFQASGVRYRDTGAGSLTSHYDRLIDLAGCLIGFVLWGLPAEAGVATTLAALPPRPYLQLLVRDRAGAPMAFGVFLDNAPRTDMESTGDQAFGGQCFVGQGGEFAVSIDLDFLLGGPGEAADLAAIRAAPVDWLELADVRLAGA